MTSDIQIVEQQLAPSLFNKFIMNNNNNNNRLKAITPTVTVKYPTLCIKNWLSNVHCQMDHQRHVIHMSYNRCGENSSYKLYEYCDRYIMAGRTIYNDRSDTVMLGRTIKETYSTDVAIANRHNLHRAVT